MRSPVLRRRGLKGGEVEGEGEARPGEQNKKGEAASCGAWRASRGSATVAATRVDWPETARLIRGRRVRLPAGRRAVDSSYQLCDACGSREHGLVAA